MRLEQLFVTINKICLVFLPLLPPSLFTRVLQSSSVQNKFNKHFQDIWAVKGYADLVHSGIAFIDIITQERHEESPHFNCFEKQAFCDLPRATAKVYRKWRKMNRAFSFWMGSAIVILTLLHSSEAAHWGDREETEAQRVSDVCTGRCSQVVSNAG